MDPVWLQKFKITILGKFLNVHSNDFPILQRDLKTNSNTYFGPNLRCAKYGSSMAPKILNNNNYNTQHF